MLLFLHVSAIITLEMDCKLRLRITIHNVVKKGIALPFELNTLQTNFKALYFLTFHFVTAATISFDSICNLKRNKKKLNDYEAI